MLSVCVSASEMDYCTCADVMFALWNSTSTANVATTQEIDYIGRLCRRASRQADQYVNYTLAQQVYSESLPGYGGRRMMLSRTPLVKVLRMFDATDTGTAAAICSTEYVVESGEAAILSKTSGWRWTADWMQSETCFNLGLTGTPRPGEMDRTWLVEYTAGYRVVGTTTTCMGESTGDRQWSTGATIPDDVVQAVTLLAANMYANPQNIAERRVGDLAIRYRFWSDKSPGWQALLDPYAREPY